MASAIANGTSNILDNVLANNVFPVPVGPRRRMLLFSMSTSSLVSNYLLYSSVESIKTKVSKLL